MASTRETNARLAELLNELKAKFEEVGAYADAQGLDVYYRLPNGSSLMYTGKGSPNALQDAEDYDEDYPPSTGWYSSSDQC